LPYLSSWNKILSLHSNINFVIADAQHLPFRNDVFQKILCFEVIEHVEEDKIAFSEMGRVLCTQGASLITTPNVEVFPDPSTLHFRHYSKKTIADVASKYFSTIKVFYYLPYSSWALEMAIKLKNYRKNRIRFVQFLLYIQFIKILYPLLKYCFRSPAGTLGVILTNPKYK